MANQSHIKTVRPYSVNRVAIPLSGWHRTIGIDWSAEGRNLRISGIRKRFARGHQPSCVLLRAHFRWQDRHSCGDDGVCSCGHSFFGWPFPGSRGRESISLQCTAAGEPLTGKLIAVKHARGSLCFLLRLAPTSGANPFDKLTAGSRARGPATSSPESVAKNHFCPDSVTTHGA